MELEYRAGKEVIIPLSLAIARENNQGSITSAQRARRATAGLGLGLALAIVSDGDIVDAIVTTTDAVLGVANALANSLVRQRRWRPDPSPEFSPKRLPEPVRARNRRVVEEQQPESRTRKRRAVEER